VATTINAALPELVLRSRPDVARKAAIDLLLAHPCNCKRRCILAFRLQSFRLGSSAAFQGNKGAEQ
jgi:hypothetical protein